MLALFAVGDVYVSLCKKAITLHLARGEGVLSKNTNELKTGAPGRVLCQNSALLK